MVAKFLSPDPMKYDFFANFHYLFWYITFLLYICIIKGNLVPSIWFLGHCYVKRYHKRPPGVGAVLRNKWRWIYKDLSGASAWTEWVETDGCNCSKVIFLHSDMGSEWLKNGRKDPSTCGKNPPCNYRMFDKCVRSVELYENGWQSMV